MLVNLFDFVLILYFYFYLGLFIFPLVGISNISGSTIGLLFLLLSRFFIDKKGFLKNPIIKILNKLNTSSDRKLLFFAFIIIFISLTSLSIVRHLSLSSGASDLGIFDQAIWNTLRGNMLFSSLKNNINLLGDHFEPILILIAPLYKIWPDCTVLFILQSLLLASAVIPLYLIAKHRLKSRLLIFAFIISYILSRPLRGVGLSDFHPECFILPLLFWAYYFLIRKANFLLFAMLLLLLLCKEDTAFLISGFGIFAYILQKRAKLGIALFILGILAWLILTKVLIPYFNPLNKYEYFNRLPFGLTYKDNITAIFNNPLLLGNFILNKEKIVYCLKLFAPLGFLSILSPAHYILIAVPLLKNLIPDNPVFSGLYNISSHYTASVIPFVFISAIYGAALFADRFKRQYSSAIIALIVIFCSLFFYGKTDASKLTRFFNTIREKRTFEKLAYLKLVPDSASVAANFNLVPHLSHRKYIYEWNPQSKESFQAQYLVIDLSLLEYLSKENIARIPNYFSEISKIGYRKIFEDKDKTLLIFSNLK